MYIYIYIYIYTYTYTYIYIYIYIYIIGTTSYFLTYKHTNQIFLVLHIYFVIEFFLLFYVAILENCMIS